MPLQSRFQSPRLRPPAISLFSRRIVNPPDSGMLASEFWRLIKDSTPMIYASIVATLILIVVRIWAADAIMAELPAPLATVAVDSIGILLSLSVALFFDGLISTFYWKRYFRRRKGHKAPALVRDLVTFFLLAIGLSVGLYAEVGVAASGLAAASGAAAVVLGFALQTMILDLFSGLSINLDRSYAIGDWLTIHSQELGGTAYGQVEGISWRTTFLHLDDDRRLIVPNRLITSNPVTNHSRPAGPKRLSVEVSIDIRTPSDRAIGMLIGEAYKAVRAHGLSDSPPPTVIISRLEQDAVFYQARFYAYPDKIQPTTAQSIMLRALQDAIRQTGLPTPVLQVELSKPYEAPPIGAASTETRDTIARVPLFQQALTAEQIEDLAGRCAPADFPAGHTLINQGEVGASMFVILEGAAAVVVVGTAGVEHEVNRLATGDIVGEMSLMTGAARNATVRALTPLRVLEIRKEAIEGLLAASPELLGLFSHVLATRQNQLTEVSNRPAKLKTAEVDLLARMRAFFARNFGTEGAADA
jgi:small-conductance mechanosensitive channel/CRP-like cAMP-binding protein